MSHEVCIQLAEREMEGLQRLSERLGTSPKDAAALLIGEGVRAAEFRGIEYRDSAVGRQAYVKGTRLTVWYTIKLIRAYAGDHAAVAEHLDVPVEHIHAAARYAEAYPEEIEEAIRDNDKSFEELKRILPNIQLGWVDI